MLDHAYIFHTSQAAPGIFDHFLRGFFLIKGVPLILQLGILALYPAAVACALISGGLISKRNKKIFELASSSLALLAFFFCTLLLFQPWDEVFINLRHSLHLAENNNFSFNRFSQIEGTVDFLIYFLLGLLAKTGLPLPELVYFQSLLGALLCILAGRKLLLAWEVKGAQVWSVVGMCLFAPLLLNASHGFVTTIFAASLLWSIYALFFTNKGAWGLVLLSVVPLIRLEGAWFSFLCLLSCFFSTRTFLRKNGHFLLGSIAVFLPLLTLTVFRLNTYGSAIPTPILFKSCFGNLFYLLLGLRNLLADLLAGYSLLALLSIAIYYYGARISDRRIQSILKPLWLLALFVIPYYSSGGDWFPSAWGRYLFPFTLYAALAAWGIAGTLKGKERHTFLFFLLAATAFECLATFGAYPKAIELIFASRKVIAPLDLKKKILRTPYRTHYLSQLGYHLHKVTENNDVIASSEIATIMFFAKREVLDLLGLTNQEISSQPLRPTPDLIRHFPKETELPYLIFKRVNPNLVEKYQPSIVYTFDFLVEELLEGTPLEEVDERGLFKAVSRWERKFQGLVGPLYGGISRLTSLGYSPVIVSYSNDFCSLYFVSKGHLAAHLAALKKEGFTGGLATKPH